MSGEAARILNAGEAMKPQLVNKLQQRHSMLSKIFNLIYL